MTEELDNKAAENSNPDNTGSENNDAENQNNENNAGGEVETEEKTRAEIEEQVRTELKAEGHKESSKLGRRISAMEDQMNSFFERADNIFTRQNNDNAITEIADDEYLTAKQVNDILSTRDQKEAENQNKYSRDYIKQIRSIEQRNEVDEETHLKVVALISNEDGKFNKASHQDPTAACEINYLKALNYLKSRDKKDLKLKGDNNTPPAGDGTKIISKKEKELELDNDTLEYMKRRGISTEKAKEYLKDKSPIYSGGMGF